MDHISKEKKESLKRDLQAVREEVRDFKETVENDRKGNTFSMLKRILLIAAIPAIIMGLACSVFGAISISTGMQKEVFDGLQSTCASVAYIYDAVNDGDIMVDESGQVYKGEYVVSGNFDAVDDIKRETGVDITVFYKDTRVVTSIMSRETGERLINTKASDKVVAEVLEGGRNYKDSDIVIDGTDYYGYYIPWKNGNGDVVGMIFAGCTSASQNSFIMQKCLSLCGLAALILIVSAIVTIFWARDLTSGVKIAEKVIEEMASGNLNVTIKPKAMSRTDEIGAMNRSLNKFIVKMKDIMSDIKSSADILLDSGNSLDEMAARTNETTGEISRAIEDISRGAVSQAEEVESASVQIGNMGSQIEDIVGSVAHLGNTAEQMKKDSDESAVIIGQLSASNDKTIEAIHKIDKQVHATNDSVQMIRQAIEIITSIAGETNLLSLNASIEAARAGEHGRGFAVVATEIQKLAEQSNASARSIEKVIDELLVESETTVRVMEEVGIIIAEQQAKLNETKEKFERVTNGVDATDEETNAIKGYTESCDKAKAIVVDVISNLSAISEENAASTEETTASMQELNATITLLAEAAGDLKELSEGLSRDMKFFKF